MVGRVRGGGGVGSGDEWRQNEFFVSIMILFGANFFTSLAYVKLGAQNTVISTHLLESRSQARRSERAEKMHTAKEGTVSVTIFRVRCAGRMGSEKNADSRRAERNSTFKNNNKHLVIKTCERTI